MFPIQPNTESGHSLQNAPCDSSDNYPSECVMGTSQNKKSCERFKQALDAFHNNNFDLAYRYMQGYHNLVCYSEFYMVDNRKEQQPVASVIIVAYNTGPDLIASIKSVFSGNESRVEVIVVDNGKNAHTLQFLLSLPILYIKPPLNLYPSEGRNIGVTQSRSPIIFFLDDDGIAHQDFVKNGLAAFYEPTIHAVRGKVFPKTADAYQGSAPHYDLGDSPIHSPVNLEGNSAWRKSTYEMVNGMDPLLYGHEGLDISERIEEALQHPAIFYWPHMTIYHNYATNKQRFDTKTARHELMAQYIQWKKTLGSVLINKSSK